MRAVEVKNIKIGCGIPKVAVPIVGATNAELIKEVNELKKIKFDIVEWRVDFYENVEDINEVKNILNEIRNMLKDTPILFTFRTKNEGGEKAISNDYYIKLNSEIINTNQIDLIDVELFSGKNIVEDLIEKAHKNNVKVIMSNHDFNKTPAKEEIVLRLTEMIKLNADIPKIAVMPNSNEDVLTLLSATNEMKQRFSEVPIITMSMGKLGVISRISGESFGSALTFGAVKKSSAPGQIDVESLNTILSILHKTHM